MKTLQVIYAGWGERWHLGTLAQTERQVLFEYTPEARRQGIEFSPLHVPLDQLGASTGETFFHSLPGFVADALPDGWGRLLMDRSLRVVGRCLDQTSVLDLLAWLGKRTIGALCFEPARSVGLDAPNISLVRLAETIALVQSDEADDALNYLLLFGGAAQGSRPKVLVDFDPTQDRISTGHPTPNTAPWLIKFPAGHEHRDACAIEELYARLARHCGLEMPESRFFDLDGRHSAFGVRRFDRTDDGGHVPLLSLGAALHVDYRLPTLDYETLLRATRRLTGDEREVLKAFERVTFNVLTHNRDDHARNFAFRLNQNRQWQLAPAFDLTYHEGPGGKHHTTIAGEGRAPGREHLSKIAIKAPPMIGI